MLSFLIGRAIVRWLLSEREAPLAPAVQAGQGPASPAPTPQAPDTRDLAHPRVERAAMGCLWEVYLVGEDREHLEGAAREALDEVERLDRQLSHTKPESDICRLNAHAYMHWVRLEPALYNLLRRCATLHEQTGGSFDVACGALVDAWGFLRSSGCVPSSEAITSALARSGMDRVAFDDDDYCVHFTVEGMQIALGAVGKGVGADAAARTLRFYGVDAAVLHGGSSTIYALGTPPGEDGWAFEARSPLSDARSLHSFRLRDRALSTSSAQEQFVQVEDRRLGHILDPRTGRPAEGLLSVWVAADTATDSDALSTALFVMGRDAAVAFCSTRPELEVVLAEQAPDGAVTGLHIRGAVVTEITA